MKVAETPQQFPLFENEAADTGEEMRGAGGQIAGAFGKFVVYVDESGDHGMMTLDAHYPVFVLSLCVFSKRYYCEIVVPAVEKFKFNHFGHDLVVLHEHEIRKEKGSFTFFQNRVHKERFISDLTGIIEASKFILISCVIDKSRLRDKLNIPSNPYHLALGSCLETLYKFLQENGQERAMTHVVFECRGKREDNGLELEFRRICDGANRFGIPFPFNVVFADKKVNSAGLQLADLVARPIGLRVVRPDQLNRAFEILKTKFYYGGESENGGAGYQDFGFQVYPGQESEKPR